MLPIHDLLNQFKTNLSTDLPALLNAEDLDDFDVYVVGYSRNPKEKGLFIYKDIIRKDDREESGIFIFQCQLQGINFETSLKYEDIITDYFITYNAKNIGMDMIDYVEVETYPIENNQGIILLIITRFIQEMDSCD